MTNTEYNFRHSAERVGLVIGAYIRITKIKIKRGFSSRVSVGDSKEGHIQKEPAFNNALYFSEFPHINMTSELKKVFLKKKVKHVLKQELQYMK